MIAVNRQAVFAGHRDCVYTLAEAPQTEHFFSAGGDGLVVLWNVGQAEQGKLVAQVGASVYALCSLPEQNRLCIGQNFDGLHLLDLADKQVAASVHLGNTAIFDLKNHQDTLWAASGDGTLTVLNAHTLAVLHRIRLSDKSVRALAVNPARQQIAAAYSDCHIRVFDLQNGQCLFDFPAHDNSVFSLAYSPDGQYLLSGSRDARLKIWDCAHHYALKETIVAHMFTINSIVYSPNGQYFATCSKDKSIKVWEAANFRLLKVIDKARHAGHGTSVNKLLWSQAALLSCSDDRSISAWEIGLPTI
jgi:WD40 repeat protein